MALTLLVGALTATRVAQAQVHTTPAEPSSSSDSGHHHRRHHSSDDGSHHHSSDDGSHHRRHHSSDDGSHHSSDDGSDSGHHHRRHHHQSSSHEAVTAPVTPAVAPAPPAPTPRAAAPAPEAPPPPAPPVEAATAPEAPAPTPPALVAAPEAPAPPAEAAPEPAAATESPALEPPRTPLPVRPNRPLSLARGSHGPVDSWKFLVGFAGLAAGLWYWKRRAPSASASPAPELQVVRRAALGNHGEVVVIEVAGQRMLLGVTPTSVQMLTMLDEPAAPHATETVADDAGMSFEARLTAAHALVNARDDARRSRHSMPGVTPDRDYDREPSRDYDRDYDRDHPRRAATRFDTHARKGAIEEQARGLLALGAQR